MKVELWPIRRRRCHVRTGRKAAHKAREAEQGGIRLRSHRAASQGWLNIGTQVMDAPARRQIGRESQLGSGGGRMTTGWRRSGHIPGMVVRFKNSQGLSWTPRDFF
jgi:hypothetical protein